MAKKEKKEASRTKYVEAVGRRKEAVARVRITPHSSSAFIVQDKPLANYFQDVELQKKAKESLEKAGLEASFAVSVKTRGGGLSAQAEAIRHGIAQALLKYDPELRPKLKAFGFLRRDPRMRERKKFGLKRARRARQWRKR